jgi:hypothetical protein
VAHGQKESGELDYVNNYGLGIRAALFLQRLDFNLFSIFVLYCFGIFGLICLD